MAPSGSAHSDGLGIATDRRDMKIDASSTQRRLESMAAATRRGRWQRLAIHPVRTVYPRLLRALGLHHVVSANTFWGGRLDVVLPETVSVHIWQYGFFEEEVCAFMLASVRPGMVVLDIGAHFGLFTLLASHLVGVSGRVVAVEPMPATFRQLCRNVKRYASAQNVIPVNCAAFSEETSLAFRDYGLIDAGLNSAFGIRMADSKRRHGRVVNVPARRCDDVLRDLDLPRVDVVKIDAESGERHVLSGMEGIIARSKPLIILEVGDFHLPDVPASSDLVAWLGGHGYAPYEYASGKIVKHETRVEYPPANLLMTPGRPAND